MPIFEFECRKCAKMFETLVRSGAQKVACPKCGSRRLKKLFSTFGLGGGMDKTSSKCSTCSSRSCSTCH